MISMTSLSKRNSPMKLSKQVIWKAVLFENMIWQYMVKTADVGIRAKDALVRLIATKQTPVASKGEIAFNEGGCSGCHVIGKSKFWSDFLDVMKMAKNGWLILSKS